MDKTQATPPTFDLQKIINRLVIVVSIGIIAHLVFLLLTNDQNVFAFLSVLKFYHIIAIVGLLYFPWIGHALRMMIWTSYLEQRLSFRTCLKIAIYTELGAAITPTLIGGGPIKLGLLINNKLSPGKAGFLTIQGGVEDFIMYVSILIIGFFHIREKIMKILRTIGETIISNQFLILGIVTLIVLLLILKALHISVPVYKLVPGKIRKSWMHLVQELGHGWHEMIDTFKQVLKNGFGHLVMSFSILILQWMSKFSVLIILLSALDIDFKPFQIYLQQWIVYVTMIFVPTPGATGGSEASFFLIFGGEIPKTALPLIVSTWRFFMYYFLLFSAVALVQYFHFYKTKTKSRTTDTL